MLLMLRLLVIFAMMGSVAACIAFAQPTAPTPTTGSTSSLGSPPPVGDPVIFLMFLRYHASMVDQIENMDHGRGSSLSLRHSAALALKLTGADFDRINPAYIALKSELDALDAEGIAYRDEVIGGRRMLDIKVLQRFETRRRDAIMRARTQLQNSLSQQGWDVLAAYIDGEFRAGVTRRALK